jgi:hypothetical protein
MQAIQPIDDSARDVRSCAFPRYVLRSNHLTPPHVPVAAAGSTFQTNVTNCQNSPIPLRPAALDARPIRGTLRQLGWEGPLPKRTSITGSELFIVDNSDEDWKVLRYLHDW